MRALCAGALSCRNLRYLIEYCFRSADLVDFFLIILMQSFDRILLLQSAPLAQEFVAPDLYYEENHTHNLFLNVRVRLAIRGCPAFRVAQTLFEHFRLGS